MSTTTITRDDTLHGQPVVTRRSNEDDFTWREDVVGGKVYRIKHYHSSRETTSLRCGWCHFPVHGAADVTTQAELEAHVANVCPIAKAAR